MFMKKEALETLEEHQMKVYNLWMIKWDEGEEGEDDQGSCAVSTAHAML